MDFTKLIDHYASQTQEAKKEVANNLASDLLTILNDSGGAIFSDAQSDRDAAESIPNRKPLPLRALSEFPQFMPEAENPNILIKGRWLERGGSAWWISTAGTGKSIASIQMAMLWSEGLPFAGLEPNGQKLKIWIVQSEDSPSRVTIDREDIIAELTEQHPQIDWRKTAENVKFVAIGPHVGADFLSRLDDILDRVLRECPEMMPDLLIGNPFLAYIGGPVSDGAYVTPFLRGGEINRKPTIGLQALLERYDIAALMFHHTPKPPTEKDIEAWIKSAFPEYQGAGSSDITNWGRSFITMMKMPDDPRLVMLTAGKNGGEIGWKKIGGATRHFLAYSDGVGITGRGRHAWRELTADELAEVCDKFDEPKTKEAKQQIDVKAAANWLCANAEKFVNMSEVQVREAYRKTLDAEGGKAKFANVTQAVKDVVSAFFADLPDGYSVREIKVGRSPAKVLVCDE